VGHRTKVLGIVTGVAVTLAILAAGSSVAAASADKHGRHQPTVHIAQGPLAGTTIDGAEAFLGVPYARPPVGRLRLSAPLPSARWHGRRDATTLPPACMQSGSGGIPAGHPTSENCLYLSIYRPARTTRHDRLPVIFWVHGGGFGSESSVNYGGQDMAEQTRSIVVTVSYRLGVLGFLAIPQMGDHAGTLGLLDQIAALRWVHWNIAAFGGDRSEVTIAGQSAGSGSVCGLLVSPLTRGLFTRAAIQSGPCNFMRYASRPAARQQGQSILAAVGCDTAADPLACLRNADAGALMAAKIGPILPPAYGGSAVPQQPVDAIAQGNWHKVPVLLGSTRWEGKMGIVFILGPEAGDVTAAEYEGVIRGMFGAAADAVLAHYPVSAYPKPGYALAAVDTDSGFACQTYEFARTLAAQVPTYQYEFDDPTSPTLIGFDLPGIDMSSAHSGELAYLFDFALVERPLTPTETTLATRMKDYWASFARTGRPSAQWPRITASDQRALRLRSGGDALIRSFADEHQCGFWASLQ
jgi:para-nitrobenzyl esterase